MYDPDDERIREALERPIEEREKIELPKATPVEQLARTRLKPAPRHGEKKKIPR